MTLRALLDRYGRFLLFCAVGGSGVVVNMAVFAAVLWLWPHTIDAHAASAGALHVNTAALLGWVVSVLSNFWLNDRLTFADRHGDLAARWTVRLGRYYLSALVALAVQLAVLNGLLFAMEQPPISAWLAEGAQGSGPVAVVVELVAAWRRSFGNLCGIAAGTIANYLLASRWVFR